MSTTTPVTFAVPDDERRAYEAAMAAAPASVGAMFLDRVATSAQAEAFRSPDGAGGWTSWTWAQTADAVREVAAGLLSLGVSAQERVAIASGTRIEWVLADLGIMCAGAATTTVYPTSTSEDVEHILRDSGSRVVVAEDAAQLAKVREHWDALPDLAYVVLVDGHDGDDRVLTWGQLRQRGQEHLAVAADAVDAAVAGVGEADLATLIYTSGTTGRPKGVRLPHRCWISTALAIEATGILTPEDLQYLWLPLSHSFGKVLLTGQVRIGFPTAVDGDLDRLVDNLAVVRPTVMAGAPRIYEKVHGKVVATTEAEGGAKLKIFTWAMGVGREVSALRLAGREPSGLLAVKHKVADRLVCAKLRNRFGGRIRFFVSGAAALSKEIGEWFHAAGIVILEGYGLTETSAAAFVNRPSRYRFGAVGLPLAWAEVRLDPTDNEVLVRGAGVMDGYHNLPDETAAVMAEDGWFRTGDIGDITPEGMLRITDRKKDLFKTSGGKYVAPSAIESRFKAICPYASQVVVHGDGRNFVSALITLDPDAVAVWAGEHGMDGRAYSDVVTSPECRAMVQDYVNRLNATLGRWETIKKFEVLARELTVEEGDLTPSMKLKRRAVERKYADVLEGFYSG
ncbi:MAG: AMP-dependent synthetase/ligase [Actinomycetes bacterium]